METHTEETQKMNLIIHTTDGQLYVSQHDTFSEIHQEIMKHTTTLFSYTVSAGPRVSSKNSQS